MFSTVMTKSPKNERWSVSDTFSARPPVGLSRRSKIAAVPCVGVQFPPPPLFRPEHISEIPAGRSRHRQSLCNRGPTGNGLRQDLDLLRSLSCKQRWLAWNRREQ